MSRWVKYYAPSYVYAAAIFASSSISLAFPPRAGVFTDKLLHFASYSVFGCLLARSFKNASRVTFKENFIILAFIVGGAYGITDEIHQLFVPNRFFEISDILSNFLGSLIGAFVYAAHKT